MADGAHLHVSAARALDTILGGQPSPTEDERMTSDQFREWILAAPDRPTTYEDAARTAAKYLLLWLQNHPGTANRPLDDTYDYQAIPSGLPFEEWGPYRTAVGIWDEAKADYPILSDLDLTGFMAGWAFNAARSCLELPPAPNPALIEIG